jgi:hypothetical protein
VALFCLCLHGIDDRRDRLGCIRNAICGEFVTLHGTDQGGVDRLAEDDDRIAALVFGFEGIQGCLGALGAEVNGAIVMDSRRIGRAGMMAGCVRRLSQGYSGGRKHGDRDELPGFHEIPLFRAELS